MARTPDDVEAARQEAEGCKFSATALRRTVGDVLERVLAGTARRAEIDAMCRRVLAVEETAGKTLRAIEQMARGGMRQRAT